MVTMRGRGELLLYTASSPEFPLGAPRSSVTSGTGLEPGAPRGGHASHDGSNALVESSSEAQPAPLMEVPHANATAISGRLYRKSTPRMQSMYTTGIRAPSGLGRADAGPPGTRGGPASRLGKHPACSRTECLLPVAHGSRDPALVPGY